MGPSRALGSVARGAGNNALPPGGGRTSIEARRVWESLIAALAGDCHSVDEVFKLLEVSWPDAKNWSTFCESRLLVRALAAYSARGWLAGSVSGVEFEGQSGWSGDPDHRRPRGWSGTAQVGHALGHHGQGLGEFEPGQV
jgi:hypothetical protein